MAGKNSNKMMGMNNVVLYGVLKSESDLLPVGSDRTDHIDYCSYWHPESKIKRCKICKAFEEEIKKLKDHIEELEKEGR